MTVLTRRTLNRTLLERQFLLERADVGAAEVVGRLVAVQGQECNAPYVGLRARVSGFERDELAGLLHDRAVVRGATLRGTQHLQLAADFGLMRPLLATLFARIGRTGFGTAIEGIEPDEFVAAVRESMTGRVLTRPELGRLLAERFPGRDAKALGWMAHFLVGLLHPPPSGMWGSWWSRGAVPCVLAEEWAPEAAREEASAGELVLRYLAGHGPATVADVQTWSGLTRLKPVVDALRPKLRTYRDEDGRELFDLADAPLANPDAPAPVRLLPNFDNLVLAHRDRTRVITDEHRRVVMPGYSQVLPTFLVDGFVAGTWEVSKTALTFRPFERLAPADAEALHAEAERLLAFVTDEDAPPRTIVHA
ncbi:winged helix DNA-binding domain-containing protein [Actinomadura flavalba]|uniref:winged helix DNA-binding domain-containing protein n=1 Tax=Actinomadura flavalba TaxID=1120938 RepID=UPI00039FA40D|nr:winged helix DNA-binding domain-containing protein [Actinomadura flavalba]